MELVVLLYMAMIVGLFFILFAGTKRLGMLLDENYGWGLGGYFLSAVVIFLTGFGFFVALFALFMIPKDYKKLNSNGDNIPKI